MIIIGNFSENSDYNFNRANIINVLNKENLYIVITTIVTVIIFFYCFWKNNVNENNNIGISNFKQTRIVHGINKEDYYSPSL